MAVGTFAGALLAAGREKPHFGLLLVGVLIFGIGFALAAIAPDAWLFGAALAIIGVSTLTFTNSTSSLASALHRRRRSHCTSQPRHRPAVRECREDD
jgi:MFS family permease